MLNLVLQTHQRRISRGIQYYPWTTYSIARACHALPIYALRAATPETTLQLFQG
jgi:hypothetical protein